MRFHVVALPHTQTNRAHCACAFTTKTLHFCEMMHSLGHEVFHYGVEGSEVGHCAEHVQVISRREQIDLFGPPRKNTLYPVDWSGKASYWDLLHQRASQEINRRKRRGDFVCTNSGSIGLPLARAVEGDALIVEFGVGYNGLLPRSPTRFRVYESYAHMHKIWGAEDGFDPDGKHYDVVIPNFLDPADYPLQEKKGDYFLFIGRLIRRKGISIAVETCNRIGARLKVAGQGVKSVSGDCLECEDGEVYRGVEYVGSASAKDRVGLYGNAIATFVPTLYVEPFGTVAVESQFAGTPALTSDFGVFSETIEHGKTGYRCRTLEHFCWAARNAHKLDPVYMHQRAVANYSMERIRHDFQEYFTMLTDLWQDGWYTRRDDRTSLDWLKR